MPVELATTFGKTDYGVVKGLRDLAAAVNKLEPVIATLGQTATREDIAKLERRLSGLIERVDILAKQVQTLQNAP